MITKSDVDRLLTDRTFNAIIDKARSNQVAVFMNSSKDDLTARENAKDILIALDKIEQVLRSVEADEAIKLKREGRSK